MGFFDGLPVSEPMPLRRQHPWEPPDAEFPGNVPMDTLPLTGLYRSLLREGPELKALAESPGCPCPCPRPGPAAAAARSSRHHVPGRVVGDQFRPARRRRPLRCDEGPEELAKAVVGFIDGIDAT